ncbi:MAG: winged helix DNA-binding protein [Butyrivibrio sp.]|nr:winged helix DNA-binding protein [Butyrivibrio sp.]
MAKNKASRGLIEFNNIFKESDNIYRELARYFGMSDCTFWILYCLRTDYAETTQSGICGSMFLPKQTINSALKKLEAQGYIELRRGGRNRRSKEIALTAEGERLCEGTIDRLIEVENITLGGLCEAELEMFLRLFCRHTELLKSNVREFIYGYGEK